MISIFFYKHRYCRMCVCVITTLHTSRIFRVAYGVYRIYRGYSPSSCISGDYARSINWASIYDRIVGAYCARKMRTRFRIPPRDTCSCAFRARR